MKHLLIIGLLLAAAGGVFYSLNHVTLREYFRPAVGAETNANTPVTTNRVVPASVQNNALSAIAPAVIANNVPAGSREANPVSTNTWESVAAGRYADLIKEIRQARGNAQ